MYKKPTNIFIATSVFMFSSYAFAQGSALTSLDIEGSTIIQEEEIIEKYQKFIDREINETDIEEMKKILSTVYLKKGFPFVKVYAERGTNGDDINIKVVEGYLKEIIWKSENDPDYLIQKLMEKFINEPIFNLTDFQNTLIKLNSMNTRKISAILDKYKDEDGNEIEGAFIVNLLEEKGKTGSITINFDNSASRQLERNQVTTNITLNDPLTKNEKISLTYTKSLMNNDMNSINGSYEKMLNIHGTTAEYSFNAGTQYPIGLLSDINFVSKTNSHSLGVSHPFIKEAEKSLYGSINFNIKNVQTEMLQSKLYSDKIRTIGLGLSGDNLDSFNGKNTYSAEVIKGIDVFNPSNTSSSLSSNTNAKQEFTKLQFQASRNQYLPYNLSFYTRTKAQATGDSLLLSEKFTVGGMDCGRGYNPSEFSGDKGYCSSNELRYTHRTKIKDLIFQPFIHFDNGKVHETITTQNVKPSATASSFGGGSKFNLPYNFNGMVVSSKAVNKKYNGSQKVKRPKLMFMFGYNFDF